jgi:Zn-dependent protease with chaperone function
MYIGIASILKLTIVIYHADAVPTAKLLRAEAIAGAVFRQAGVETVWRTATPQDLSPRPNEIPLHVLPTHPDSLSHETSGYAILMGNASYASVSWVAVRATASALEADESVVLGAVIAHELGHILLRTRSHATNGIMVTRLAGREIQAAGRGELQFLRSEAHRIRAEAQRRTSAKVQ